MSQKETIEKITALKLKIESLEANCENKFYYSDKRNSTLNRADEKIEELVQQNNKEHTIITVSCRDKDYQISLHLIKTCPFKTILFEKLGKDNTNVYIDIGHKYLKYALELMRKALIRTTHTFQRKIKLLIYPVDRIEPTTFIEFLSSFFVEIDDKTLFSNFDLMFVPKKENNNYSAPVDAVTFLTDKEIEKMVNQTSKQQSNKEKKQLVERKDQVHKDSFFDMKKDDGVDYLSSVFNEKVEFEE